MSGLICAGDVYLDLFASGVLTGAVGPINATKFAISPGKATSIDRTSYLRDSFGSALDSVVIPGVSTLSIETDDAAAELLQYALLGTLTSISDAPGSVLVGAPELVTAHSGKWSKLAHRNVASVVVKDSAATTAVNGTDYVLDTVAGLVKPIAGSSVITDGEVMSISYTYGALTARQIIAATQTEVRAKVRLDGKNLANQKKVEVVCYQAVLVPSGELDMMGSKFITFGLSGTLISDATAGGPVMYREID